ncbi:hypothetical protein RIF29_27188 [Crotalaria pallida]|uniref:Gag1-like clamp domain-containing protein n=1 Tax=Crotalaria pallida TaxID=3830 RepID=A0AAN9I0T4_CROPI
MQFSKYVPPWINQVPECMGIRSGVQIWLPDGALLFVILSLDSLEVDERYIEFACLVGGMNSSRCCLLALLDICSRKKPCCSFLLFFGVCFRTLVLSAMETLKLKCKGLLCSRGCLGCCTKPPVIISMDDPSKVPRTQSQTVNKDNRSEDFWSTSTLDMDHSAAQSQRSVSSIGLSNNPSDPQSSTGSQIGPPEFVNHGLLLWNQLRQQWVGNKKSESQKKEVREPRISTNASYDNLLGNNKPFPQPIPLGEMIDFLVDIWEQDGLFSLSSPLSLFLLLFFPI